MSIDVRQTEAEVAAVVGQIAATDRRSPVPRRSDDDLMALTSLRIDVLEDQLAIVIGQRQVLVRDLSSALRLVQAQHAELHVQHDRHDRLEEVVARLRLATLQMGGLFTVLADVVADQAGPDVTGALYVAGAAAKEIVANVA